MRCLSSIVIVLIQLGFVSFAKAEELTALIEQVNESIDSISSPEDRNSERELVANIADEIVLGDLKAASLVAEKNALQSSLPQLREQWNLIKLQLQKESAIAADQEAATINAAGDLVKQAWASSDPRDYEPIKRRLSSITIRHHMHRRAELQTALADISSWQHVLRLAERELIVEAVNEIDRLRRANNSISADVLASKRVELTNDMRDWLAKFSDAAQARIAACESIPEKIGVLNEIAQTDLSRKAISELDGFEQVTATVNFAAQWRDGLRHVELKQTTAGASVIQKALTLDVTEGLEQLAAQDLDLIKHRMTSSISDHWKAFQQRLDAADSLADVREVLEWEFERPLPMADETTAGHTRMMQLRACSQLWHTIRESVEQEDIASALASAQEVEAVCQEMTPLELAVRLEESIQAGTQQLMSAYMQQATDLLVSSDSSEATAEAARMLEQPLERALERDEVALSRLNTLKYVAGRWRDYFTALDSLEIVQAATELDRIENHLDAETPRSDWFDEPLQAARQKLQTAEDEVWANYLTTVQQAIKIAEQEHDLLRLRVVLNNRSPMPQQGKLRHEVENFKKDVEILNRLLESQKMELSNASSILSGRNSVSPHRWSNWADAYEVDLVLPMIAATGQLDGLEPKQDESLKQLLLRTADEAFEQEDWSRLHSALHIYKTFYGVTNSRDTWLDAELHASKLYVQAMSMEASGDPGAAKRLYESVLNFVAARVPRKQAEAKLMKLRKD